MHSTEINAYVKALRTLCKQKASNPEEADTLVMRWELEKSDCAALRNNLGVMMADFCVRYTALVDCYIAKIMSVFVIHVNLGEGRQLYCSQDYCRETTCTGEECYAIDFFCHSLTNQKR